MKRAALVLICLNLIPVGDMTAKDWAHKVFKVHRHDFGDVARNAKSEFVFEIENPFTTDLHIAGVRTSCGCTTPKILKKTITTYEKGGILTVYNTDRFQGRRSATLTVTFDRPHFAEVQLTVQGNIRNDIEINPGVITFGAVDMGQTSEQKAQVRYQGRRSWEVVGLRGESEYFDIDFVRLGNHSNAFEIVARLKPNAPVGYFQEQVILMTNHPDGSEFPLSVEGRIVPPVVIGPAVLHLGVIQPGQTVSKKIVVRGKKPFRIVSIEPKDERFSFQVPTEAKKIHIVPLSFTAGTDQAKIVETIEVVTDIGEGVTATCQASAAVIDSIASN